MEPNKEEPRTGITEEREASPVKKGGSMRLLIGIGIVLLVTVSAITYFAFWKPQQSPRLAASEIAQLKYDTEQRSQDKQKADQIRDEAYLVRKDDNNQAQVNSLLKDLNMDKKAAPGSAAPVPERPSRAEEEAIAHILRNSNTKRVQPEPLYRPPERRTSQPAAQPAAQPAVVAAETASGPMFVYSRNYGGAKYVDGQQKHSDASPKHDAATIPAVETHAKVIAPKKQDQTNEQLTEEKARLIYNDNPPVTLYEGEMLDAVLVNRIITDKEPSPVICQLARDIFDCSTRYVVFPAGTRILGSSQVVTYKGAQRLFITFDRILLPGGASLDLPSSRKALLALDQTGALGVVSKVDRHWFMQFGTALFFGVLDGLSAAAQQGQDTSSTKSVILGRTSENFGRILDNIMSQYSSIVPTIRVDQGKTLKICLSEDIVISPYSKITDRGYYAKP